MSWPLSLPLVAILRGLRPDEALDHARALLDAGFKAIEVPTNSPDWASSVRVISSFAGATALVGAGTVLTSAHLDSLIDAGGRLSVSPHTDAGLIGEAVRRGLVALPGVMTPTEAITAWLAGAQGIKLFPAASLGPRHVKALRAVLPDTLPVFAVGGIGPDDLQAYRAAGCQGAGLGSELFRPGQSAADTAAKARHFVSAWHLSSPAQPAA